MEGLSSPIWENSMSIQVIGFIVAIISYYSKIFPNKDKIDDNILLIRGVIKGKRACLLQSFVTEIHTKYSPLIDDEIESYNKSIDAFLSSICKLNEYERKINNIYDFFENHEHHVVIFGAVQVLLLPLIKIAPDYSELIAFSDILFLIYIVNIIYKANTKKNYILSLKQSSEFSEGKKL